MKTFIKRAAALFMAAVLTLTATGCWGKHELTELFFVTGIAIDTTSVPGEFQYTLQVAKPQSASSGSSSGGSKSSEKASLILTATEKTMSEALNTIDRNASRKVFIHHNQVILFSEELAREGLGDHIDIFMRDQESRMEVPIAVVAGKASDLLSQEMEQDKVTGAYLSHMFYSRASVSPNYKVAILDFASRLLDKSISPVVPLLALKKNGDKTLIEIAGLAVFKGDKMVGMLDNDEVYGYVWAMGGINSSLVAAQTDQGRASFVIETLDSAKKVERKDGGGVKVTLTIDAKLFLDEMIGFTDVPGKELVDFLSALASDAIKTRIVGTFEKARSFDADIYGFGQELYHHNADQWHAIEGNWDAEFQNIEFDVRVTVYMPSTGKISQSVEMEERK